MKDKFKKTEIGEIPEGWRVIVFKDILVGNIKHGIYKSKEFFTDTGVRILKMGVQYSNDRIGIQKMERVAVTEDELERFKIKKGDLIFSRTSMMTDGAGKCSLVIDHDDPIVFDGNLLCAELNSKIAYSEFYFYFFNSKTAKDEISRITTGTQSRNISGSNLMKMFVPLPLFSEQQYIASILFYLDDKIALNRAANATLEAIGQAIFEHWFIDFEFPNEEGKPYKSSGGEMLDSGTEFGEVPKGWRVGRLGEIADNIRRGARPQEIELYTPYIGLEHMPRKNIALADWDYAKDIGSKKYLFHRGDILFGKLRPYFHKVGITAVDGVCSTDILVVVPRQPIWYGLVLYNISSVDLVNHADATSKGTKMPRTNWADIARFQIMLPTNDITRKFTENILPIIKKIQDNILQSRTLAAIRDALLPKLMSGEIQVPIEAKT